MDQFGSCNPERTLGTQYPFLMEYSIFHTKDPGTISGIFLDYEVFGFLGRPDPCHILLFFMSAMTATFRPTVHAHYA